MIYEASSSALIVFLLFVLSVLGLSFYLGAKAKSAAGYYAAHGQIPWFVNGVAFAGDYLSAASFLGICGMIAFFGYDGFLYSIGYLAGWIVALLVIAEPLKRLGKFTFADALDSRFHSSGIRLMAAISTLVVSILYLIPQMVGAGALVRPLLGIDSFGAGVAIVGAIVILIVVTAGMVSTTWVQFIKGAMLVCFCTVLTVMILQRGLTTDPKGKGYSPRFQHTEQVGVPQLLKENRDLELLPDDGAWKGRSYLRFKNKVTGLISVYRVLPKSTMGWTIREEWKSDAAPYGIVLSQTITKETGKPTLANGSPQEMKDGVKQDLWPVGNIEVLMQPGEKPLSAMRGESGPLGPISYFRWINDSAIVTWRKDPIPVVEGNASTTIYYPEVVTGSDVLTPGGSPTFKDIRGEKLTGKLDFLSLMIALFAGTASLPHILIRYYTVKDQAAVRKSTVVGIATIGFFYILTLYLGLGAMTSGVIDPSNENMTAPLLARSFGELPFALISAIAFTTVLGTVSGLILAASGAVAHDLATSLFKLQLNDDQKVRIGKIAAVVVGVIGILLGIVFKEFNVTFLVGWAFNVAASANLPALVMLLFWRGTTKQGITASICVGLFSSLAWVFASPSAYKNIYGITDPNAPLIPFNQPAIVTLPLSFLVLVVVSLVTQPAKNRQ